MQIVQQGMVRVQETESGIVQEMAVVLEWDTVMGIVVEMVPVTIGLIQMVPGYAQAMELAMVKEIEKELVGAMAIQMEIKRDDDLPINK